MNGRPICRGCNRRPALACVRGEWRVVKDHDLCRQCWRSLMDSRRAEKLAALERDRRSTGWDSRSGIVRGIERSGVRRVRTTCCFERQAG